MLPLLVNKDEYTSLRPAYLNASSIIGICVKVEWRHHDIINWKQDKDQLQAMDRKTYNLSSEEKRI